MNCPPKRREVIYSIGLIAPIAVLLWANSARAIPTHLADSDTAKTASVITISQVEVVGSTILSAQISTPLPSP